MDGVSSSLLFEPEHAALSRAAVLVLDQQHHRLQRLLLESGSNAGNSDTPDDDHVIEASCLIMRDAFFPPSLGFLMDCNCTAGNDKLGIFVDFDMDCTARSNASGTEFEIRTHALVPVTIKTCN